MQPRRDGPSGPLAGLRLVEFAGIGPAPFATMLLADLGVEIVRVDRAGAQWPDVPIVSRGRATLTLDLKDPQEAELAARIAAAADILIEGFRPGVMERLGLGPDALMARNERLIYGRMTGWGQTGPRAQQAGHDINYIGLTGMLAGLGRAGGPPLAPLNLLGDYGGGGLYLALGVLAALWERERSGRGQIVDAAIVDGAASLYAPILGMISAGLLPREPSEGILGGDYPFYRVYTCADGRNLAVGALEPHFRKQVANLLGICPESMQSPEQAPLLEGLFATRSRDEWLAIFDDADCCVSPVLELDEAVADPHLSARGVFIDGDEGLAPAPAPRFSRTPGAVQPSGDAADCLQRWGVKRPGSAT